MFPEDAVTIKALEQEDIGLKGYHITFHKTGWVASVQFGPYAYCDHYSMRAGDWWGEKRDWAGTTATAEVAAWDRQRTWKEFPDGDTVAGYYTLEQALEFVREVSEWA
jgi:hypothetical protein